MPIAHSCTEEKQIYNFEALTQGRLWNRCNGDFRIYQTYSRGSLNDTI